MIQLCDKKDCTGCGLCLKVCSQNAIEMLADTVGFEYPSVNNSKCINCGACIKACPQITKSSRNKIMAYYKGYTLNAKIREKSTSGGLVTQIAKNFVSENGTYFGVTQNDLAKDKIEFCFYECTDTASVKKGQGSKYVQVYLHDTYTRIKSLLKDGKKVLFVGTPCQVDAVKRYVRDDKNLFTIDFICHGVASGDVFNSFVNYQLKKYCKRIEDVENIRFRDKEFGYDKGMFVVNFRDGTEYREGIYQNPFGYGFASDLLSRESCMHCKYASLERTGDLTVADLLAELSPEEKEKGVTLCTVNTEKGKALMNLVLDDVYIIPVDEKMVIDNSYHLTKVPSHNPKRKDFFEDYSEGTDFQIIIDRYLIPKQRKNTFLKRVKSKIKTLIKKKH